MQVTVLGSGEKNGEQDCHPFTHMWNIKQKVSN